MPKTQTRQKAGVLPACLEKATVLLQLYPLAIELLMLVAVLGLIIREMSHG